MPGFLNTLEDKDQQSFSIPDTVESDDTFLNSLDNQGSIESDKGEDEYQLSAENVSFADRVGRFFKKSIDPDAAVLAMVNAEIFDMSPSNALRLQDVIKRGVDYNPAALELRSTRLQTAIDSIKRGYETANNAHLYAKHRAFDNTDETWESIQASDEFLSQPVAIPETRFEEMLQSAGEMAPMFVEGFRQGAWPGLALSGGAAALGAATGTLPAVTPLLPTMYAVGQTYGSIKFMNELEGGLAYKDLINYRDPETGENIDPAVARVASYGVGAINAVLEMAQLKTLINAVPGGRKFLARTFTEAIKEATSSKALVKAASRYSQVYGKTIVTETGQELAQESTNIVAEIFARLLTNKLNGTDLSTLPRDIVDPITGDTITGWDQITDRLHDTMVTSAQAFALMSAPGPIISTGHAVYDNMQGNTVDLDVEDQITKIIKVKNINELQTLITPEFIDAYEVSDNELNDATDELDIDSILGDKTLEDEFITQKMREAGFEPLPDRRINEFADIMVVGGSFETAEDRQFYINNAEAIEENLRKRLEDNIVPGSIGKAVDNSGESIADQINELSPGHSVKYDGEMDLSVLNRPNAHQFTAYEGPARGATFMVPELNHEAVQSKLNEMIGLRKKTGVDSITVEDTLQQVSVTLGPSQGSTFSLQGKDMFGTPNISVAIFPEYAENVPTAELTDRLTEFKRKHYDLISRDDFLNVGTWRQGKEVVLDIVSVIPLSKEQTAIDLGKKYNQEAIFNLGTGEEIPTGGTGKFEDMDVIPSVDERLSEIRNIVHGDMSSMIGDDGNVTLTHWSNTYGLTELDPEYYGTGIKSEETKRRDADPDNWVNRTSFGMGVGGPQGYVKEKDLGTYEYTVKIPPSELYDFNGDPEGLKAKVKEAKEKDPFINPLNIYEKLIKENGHNGYWTKDNADQVQARVFKTTTPETNTPGSIGLYSAVGRAVENMDFKKIPAKDLVNRLKKTQGLKVEEFDDLGIIDWLEGVEGKVDKTQVMEFIQKGGPQLEEVRYTREIENNYYVISTEYGDAFEDKFDTEGEAQEYLDNYFEEQDYYNRGRYEISHYVHEIENEDDEYDLEPGFYVMGHSDSSLEERYDTEEEAQEIADKYNDDEMDDQRQEFESGFWIDEEDGVEDEGDTEYHDYSTRGGEDYREVLVTVPNAELKARDDRITELTRKLYSEEGVTPDEKDELDALHRLGKYSSSSDYESPHWSEPNVLVHYRIQTMRTRDDKTLLIDEIQSDWHQTGRSDGYQDLKILKKIKENEAKILATQNLTVKIAEDHAHIRRRDYADDPQGFYDNLSEISPEYAQAQKDLQDAINVNAELKKQNMTSTDFHIYMPGDFELTENEFNWTISDNHGTTHQVGKGVAASEAEARAYFTRFLNNIEVERHSTDSANKVPDVAFKKSWHMLAFRKILQEAIEQGFTSVSWTPGGVQADRYSLRKQVDAIQITKNKSQYDLVAIKRYEHREDQPVVRKESLSIKEIEGLLGKGLAEEISNQTTDYKEYTGDDLEIGGKGMIGFYDKILVNEVGKYIKKLDKKAKVGAIEVTTNNGNMEVWNVPITDKMIDKVNTEGQPIYGSIDSSTSSSEAQPFSADKIVHHNLREAVDSGLISIEEAAIIDGIMKIVGEKGWSQYFDARVSGQRFTPSAAQLDAHGIPADQAHLYQLEGALLTDKSHQEIKDLVRNIAVIFQGGDITTFFHEFGEFAYSRLLTGENDRSTVHEAYKASGSKQSENEWFADNFRDWWFKTLEGDNDIVSPGLRDVYKKMVRVIKTIWQRIKSFGTPTPALDELFIDIIVNGRQVAFGTGEITVSVKTDESLLATYDSGVFDPTNPNIHASVGEQPAGLREYRLTQQALKDQTGQTSDEEQELLRFALKKASYHAYRAHSAGNKEGVIKEKKRMAIILERAKQRKANASEIKKTKSKIVTALKRSKVTKSSGKPKGRYGADRQATLDLMRGWVNGAGKLTKAKAREVLANRIEGYGNNEIMIPTEFECLENKLLVMIGSPTTDLKHAQSLLADIIEFKATGEAKRDLKAQNRAAYHEVIIEDVIRIAGGIDYSKRQLGGKASPDDKPLKQRIRNLLFTSGGTNYVQAWDDLLDILSYNDVDSKPGESIISTFGNVHENENAEKRGNMDQMVELQEMVLSTYGLKDVSQMTKLFEKDSVKVDLGHIADIDGNVRHLEFTKAEARKMVMALLDPSLYEVFFSDKGQMRWSQDISAALYDMMTPQDLDFIKKQMDWYQRYYDSINNVYKEIYGVNLPKNQFYSPISREGVNKEEGAGLGEFLKDAPFRASASGQGSLMSRTANYNPISQQSDIAVLQRHVMEMEHFKAWAQKIRDLNAVFNNPDVRSAISENFGQNINSHLEDTIQALASGGNEKSNLYGFFDNIRIKYTQSVLAVKVALFMKQLTSVVAFADAIPVKYWSKEFTKLLLNPNELTAATKLFMTESTLVEHRWARGSVERDIAAAIKTDEYKAFKAKPSFMNKLMFMVRLGDMAAIVAGGYPVYKYYLEKTGDKEQAMRYFESVTSSTQQSSDISKMSPWQRGNPIMKLFTMFKTSPVQYLRKEISAVRNLSAGRITSSEFTKTIIIYHFVLPLLFQTMSELIIGGEDDEWFTKGQKRAMILGSLNGFFIIGDGLDYMLKKMLGLYADLPTIAPNGIWRDLNKALKLWDWDDLTDSELISAIRGLAGASGAATGAPVKQVVDTGIGTYDIIAGEYEKGILELMGWSPFAAEKATED